MRFISIVLAFVLLVGCTTSGKKFSETADKLPVSSDKSRVVVYRSTQNALSDDSMSVLDNGKEMGTLNIGEVGIYDTDPGDHIIYTDETGEKGRKAHISMKPGEIYYVKFTVYDNYYLRMVSAVFISDEMTEKNALRDIQVLREQAKE
ncbi:DUF2846 domain-containing protein [Sneathiella marina]|uniref:DUF2846 domain-containing protein n=1 Tax=Sneathiella marina TaxID=2950108 RepID=A0ABY4W7S3_9PROT|nr:DUF2846 domain-containing protein [Sneathiella marina]USG63230.1 DUF2846 domain-containing protein [Sneathiella marina]